MTGSGNPGGSYRAMISMERLTSFEVQLTAVRGIGQGQVSAAAVIRVRILTGSTQSRTFVSAPAKSSFAMRKRAIAAGHWTRAVGHIPPLAWPA